MKTLTMVFAIALLSPQMLRAQGTVYLSNLGQTPTGTNSIGSDSWVGSAFITGVNTGGYSLNSVQLAMADASGAPSGFTAMIYLGVSEAGGVFPGSSVGMLTGSLSPTNASIYTFTPASGFMLSPSTHYFIADTSHGKMKKVLAWPFSPATRQG